MRPILFDTTRLLTRLRHAAPTGIDRVDLAYLRRYVGDRPDGRGAAIVRETTRILPDAKASALRERIAARWNEEVPADRDPGLARIRGWLRGQRAEPDPPPEQTPPRGRWRGLVEEQLFKLAAPSWADAPRAAARDAIFLHSSHLRLDRPKLFDWLSERRDIRPVFFVHDLIPIEYPEYGVPGEAARHMMRMATVARHAAAVLVNSADVGERFARLVRREGWRTSPIAVAPLGVEPAFLPKGPPSPTEAGRPYFVVCSTIEARKNHLLLLQLWRELATASDDEVPALVIVGRRGWESESAVDLLDRCPAIRDHVLEATALSTPALAALVRGARALLMPSFAEGYGIPVAEALSLGTPVIASDLPVFREVAGPAAELLHPLDGPGWLSALRRHARWSPAERLPSGYRSPTWTAHFRIVDDVLAGL